VQHDRKICLIGRSMRENIEVAHDLATCTTGGEWFVDIDDVAWSRRQSDHLATAARRAGLGAQRALGRSIASSSWARDLVIISADPFRATSASSTAW